MRSYAVDFDEIEGTAVEAVGGKGARLGELARLDGVRVPDGFVVTTDAFRRALDGAPAVGEALARLDATAADDAAALRARSAEVREAIERATVPADVASAIGDALARHDADAAWAVRSSATAEDGAAASFAGQHDSHLHVVGRDAVLEHVARCWASLFTERAVAYRARRGVPHRDVAMAVVVQRMVVPRASGVLFTADPSTSNRRVAAVEATVGLGEALVSGLVTPDGWTVRDGRVLSRHVEARRTAVRASPEGGTEERAIPTDERCEPALTDAQVVELVGLGRRIEAASGGPQDVEWCLDDDGFAVVQSRPITTLFPVPDEGDERPHVYVSVGHQQMMTDAMRPLGLSLHLLVAMPHMRTAAGRLFVDIADRLASPAAREAMLGMWRSDPLTGGAIRAVVDAGFVPTVPDEGTGGGPGTLPASAAPEPIATDPAIVTGLVGEVEASLAALARDIDGRTGPALLDFVLADVAELKRLLFHPTSMQAIMAALDTTAWLNERLEGWLGETNAADALTQSAPGNVTSEMGLALLDVADAVRPHPDVVAFLRRIGPDDDVLDGLDGLGGGPEARDAIRGYLDRYGMHCVGEIDITRPRWAERPATLVPLLLSNVDAFEPGEARRRFERGLRTAAEKERDVLQRLRALPDGEEKAAEAKRTIDRVRTFIGYREYPKYGWICRYAVYKRALMGELGRLVAAGVLRTEDDAFFLTLEELAAVVRTHEVDLGVVDRRRREFASYEAMTPPRVMTSEGEVVTGSYDRDDLPDGALPGLAVSGGTVEGRARVVLDMQDADLEEGDVLVTAYTDPSWSPLFVAAAALVTEVGGLMTHGAVVAREYGLPAVVGVEGATALIRDGQRIRVHGTEGFVELLD